MASCMILSKAMRDIAGVAAILPAGIIPLHGPATAGTELFYFRHRPQAPVRHTAGVAAKYFPSPSRRLHDLLMAARTKISFCDSSFLTQLRLIIPSAKGLDRIHRKAEQGCNFLIPCSPGPETANLLLLLPGHFVTSKRKKWAAVACSPDVFIYVQFFLPASVSVLLASALSFPAPPPLSSSPLPLWICVRTSLNFSGMGRPS